MSEYLKKQIREGCRQIKDLQSRAKLFVDQTILLEENPTIFRQQFQPIRKKIKNLITAVKVQTKFVYFLSQSGRTYFTNLLRAVPILSALFVSFFGIFKL